MLPSQLRPSAKMVLRVFLLLILLALIIAPHLPGEGPIRQASSTHVVLAQAGSDVTPLLAYQGRLLTPGTGEPKPNGAYPLELALYTAETGGTPIWSEAKDVEVVNGRFTTYLGDTNPLPVSDFDGRDLWLGVKVGSDPEASPRQRITPTGYALYAGNSAKLGGQGPSAFAASAHTHEAEAINAGSLSADRFSAYGDLVAENRIGAASGQVAAGNHKHTDYTNTKCNFQFVTFSAGTAIAHAFIAEDGTKASGSGLVTSSFNTSLGRYEIKISGYSYFWTDYTTVVTAAGDCNAIPETGSVSGLLLVEFRRLN